MALLERQKRDSLLAAVVPPENSIPALKEEAQTTESTVQ